MAMGKGRSPSDRKAKGGFGTSDHVKARQEKRQGRSNSSGGPKSIHDVFEYATEQEERGKGGNNKGSQRRLQRATTNGTEMFDRPNGKRAAADDSDEEEEDEHDARAHASSSKRPDYGTAPILGDDDENEYHVTEIASEDDEEIDSDEAFGESDDERYADWKFASDKNKKQGMKGKRSRGPANDEEDEEASSGSDEEEDEDDADMMDLSKMLDGGSEDDSADDDEDDDDDDDDDDDETLQKHIEAFGKGTSKRDSEAAALGSGPSANKRRVLQDRTEAVPEGEWNAPIRREGAGLTIDDLLKPIADHNGTSLTALRGTAKALRPPTSANDKQPVASKKGGGKLHAPLPTIVQDRLDRSAAYNETKAEVDGWQPTIKRLREAEHLSFPLQPDPVVRPSTAALAGNFKASNDFEQDIAAMLEREGATEKQMTKAEELEMNNRGMSADEIRRRTGELRRMRELLFREEQKAKRVSKIKSKTYRRIARKQKQRDEEKARQAGLLNGEGDEEDDEESRMKAERARAKERATLKHKNAGKWAKDAIGMKGIHDMPETRKAVEDQLLRGEQLRRRIQGDGSDDDEDDSDADTMQSDDNRDNDRERGFDEMATLKKNLAEEDANVANEGEKKGVWNMKFMREARERQAKDSLDQMDAFEKEMQENEGSDDDEVTAASMQIGQNAGRRVFSATSDAVQNGKAAGDEGEEEASHKPKAYKPLTKTDAVNIRVDDVRPIDSKTSKGKDETKDVNPWLVDASQSNKVSRKKNEATISKDGSALNKAANRIQKHASKNDDARLAEQQDGELVIDPEAQLALRQEATQNQSKKQNGKKSVNTRDADEDSNDDSDGEEDIDEPVEVNVRKPKTAMQQRQLVSEAFAGDDVLADFAAEKQAEIDAEKPQEVDTYLPGWGSWSGKGVRTSKKKAEERKKQFTKTTAGLDPTKRKDFGMSNVIINQKRDKKADKFKSDDVPFPYTSRAQYEMAMRNPLGPEWNTRTQHQRMTLPKVLTKPGKAIKPIEKLF
ncbi:Utp14-domain-containing protein [Meira miltonrushii]|uniref:Utp14-domain-containing protein n=1 Tax=Meira miltonrushii TaxID=1280837 RepID=A0A316V994_9BASI|nr:Utp14-domain-containing protein [Meira miltonrushii]PWN34096.1 Utp14-domain-containing protein [Meira miltonrushii]